ncbi:MAG: DUF3365 domain-containing protein [Gammaproteobacteria bacterium]|nr:DUF3365 domain-containing protein [Gammaproteobacteria bacterium]
MSLTAKFNLIIVAAFLLGLAATGAVTYKVLQDNARRHVVESAGLMMSAAGGIRTYTVGEIRPLLADQMAHEFLPQSVPAYSATQAFQHLRTLHPEYVYKEATLNPTNPRDRAADWEADIINRFRNFADSREIIGERDTPTGRSLYLARPIKITDEGCLVCHSTPDRAPRSMVARYGDDNGFGWQMNEVVGAQVVSVPMAVPVADAQRTFLAFMATLTAIFLLLMVALNITLRRVVITPVTRMAREADKLSKGDFGDTDLDDSGGDEIATLARSFNRLRRSMEKALDMLER